MIGAVRELPDVAHFEVSSLSADIPGARLAVCGRITTANVGLLASAVQTHLRAGRRYIRVDVSGAAVIDPFVLDALTHLHATVRGIGGMLLFENPTRSSDDLLAGFEHVLRAQG